MRRIWMVLMTAGLCIFLLAGCTEEKAKETPPPQEKPLQQAENAMEKAAKEVEKGAEKTAGILEQKTDQASQALRETGRDIQETMAAAEARHDPDPDAGMTVYQKNCAVCHSAGVAGAPKTGDQAAWGPRIAKGMDALVKNTIQGIGAMPPKGGNAALSEEEIRAAVNFMVGRSR